MTPNPAGPLPMDALVEGPLDAGAFLAGLPAAPASGAVVLFSGTVRDHHQGRGVAGIRYHAHPPLVRRQLADLCADATSRYGLDDCHVTHAHGWLVPGDSSVLAVARAAHRPAAFGACEWLMAELKRRVAVWKEEHFTDGAVEFQEGVPVEPPAEPPAETPPAASPDPTP